MLDFTAKNSSCVMVGPCYNAPILNRTGSRPMKLLGIDTNVKTVKGQSKGYMTAILYLAPANISGYEVCPMATAGCRAACLYSAGRGAFSNVQKSRIAKTKWFFEDRTAFMAQLVKEIAAFIKYATKRGFIPTVRLNGTSDIVWERVAVPGFANVMDMFPSVQFYDYTKRHNRKDLPANYHLTFSLAEGNDDNAFWALRQGMNVAAVFRKVPKVFHLPRTRDRDCVETGASLQTMSNGITRWVGNVAEIPVVDGDESDLRFLDPRGVIVGLKAKGKARKDTTGFVKEVA